MVSVVDVENYEVSSFINKKVESVKTMLEANRINYRIVGNGNKVMKQIPAAGTEITDKDKVYLITNDENITVPDVNGLSSKVAKELLEKLGIKVKLDGVGYVVAQSVPSNTKIEDGLEITLTLQPKYSLDENS